jgi:hypothetical protein
MNSLKNVMVRIETTLAMKMMKKKKHRKFYYEMNRIQKRVLFILSYVGRFTSQVKISLSMAI